MNKLVILLFALIALACSRDDVCNNCKVVVDIIEGWAAKDASEQYISEQVDMMCNLLPSPFGAKCIAGVKADGSNIVKRIFAQETPSTVCEDLNLCFAAMKLPPKKVQAVKVGTKDPISCYFCGLAITDIEDMINSNATEQEIEDYLKMTLCQWFLGGETSPECKDLCDLVPELIGFITNGSTPTQICTILTFCPAPLPKVKGPLDDSSCLGCQFVCQSAELYLSANATEQELEDILRNDVCPALPSGYLPQCTDLVNRLPDYLKMLVDQEPPLKICQQLSLCVPSPAAVSRPGLLVRSP